MSCFTFIVEVKVVKYVGDSENSFYSVLALEHVHHSHKENLNSIHEIQAQGRKFIHENISRDGKFRYVIKKMTSGIFKKSNRLEFAVAVVDLAFEAKLLSSIQHPHIIDIRAMADVDYCSKDFFILLDRLNLTLSEQVCIWKSQEMSVYGANANHMKIKLFCERLSIGHDICSALDYLHKKR